MSATDFFGFLVFLLLGACCGILMGHIFAVVHDHERTDRKIKELRKLLGLFVGFQGVSVVGAFFKLTQFCGYGLICGTCVVFIYYVIRTERGKPQRDDN